MTSSIACRVYEACHLTGSFRLRSGQVSSDYFDKYLFAGQPGLLREVAEVMVGLLPAECEVLAGMEMGGIPIATVMSQLTGVRQAGRVGRRRRDHGRRAAGVVPEAANGRCTGRLGRVCHRSGAGWAGDLATASIGLRCALTRHDLESAARP
jgi:orotate phosphoribosyltransferase